MNTLAIPPITPLAPVMRPPVSRMIWTSTTHFRLVRHPLIRLYHPPEEIGLGIISNHIALRERNFPSAIYAPVEGEVLDIEEDAREIVDAFVRMGAREKGAAVGIGTTTDEYYKFKFLSDLLRREFAGIQIFAGGPHLAWQRHMTVPETVRLILEDGAADFAQVGHGGGTINYLTRHNGRPSETDIPGFYFRDPDTGEITGHGKGRFPKIKSVPYYYSPIFHGVDIFLKDSCGNGCEYCSADATPPHRFSIEQIIRGLKTVFANFRPRIIDLLDPNPFEERDFDYYHEAFEILDGAHPTMKSTYLNAAFLVSDYYRAQLVKMFTDHNIFSFHVGRDVVTEENARHIGSKYRGRVKTQAQLDDERDAVMAFARAMSAASPYLSLQLELGVTYVVSPFETVESYGAMLHDLLGFSTLENEKLHVSFGLFPLMPYPGTPVRERLKDRIDPADYEFNLRRNGAIAPWKEGLGPNIEMIRRVPRIFGMDEDDLLERFVKIMPEAA